MIYFNYYVHSINNEAAYMFFVYNNLSVYSTSTGVYLKEAISIPSKELASHNTSIINYNWIENDGELYLLDVVDLLLDLVDISNRFRKRASRFVYSNFLKHLERAEGNELCDVSDSYNLSQTLRNYFL